MATDELSDKIKIVLGPKDAKVFDKDVMAIIDSIEKENGDTGDFSEKIADHLDVFQGFNVSPKKYINACNFVMHYMYTHSKTESYRLCFPEKYKEHKEAGRNISAASHSYFTSKLVRHLVAQSTISLGLYHRSKVHDLVETLYDLSENSENERIRMESADKLLNHLTVEDQNTYRVEHQNVGGGKRDFVGEIADQMIKMREEQKAAILNGGDVKEIANTSVVEAEIIE